jgi:hypothetical protein
MVDFDPGLGDDYHTATSIYGVFLSKFDPLGNFKWARTWGGLDDTTSVDCRGIGIDPSNGVYVTGEFFGMVDFDPGPGEDFHQSNSDDGDVFLSKFDTDGNFLWVRVWGGTGHDEGWALAFDNFDKLYVTGGFEDTVDFDPGDGVDEYTSNGLRSVFLSSFYSDGAFLWARTWACEAGAQGWGNGVTADGFGNVFVTGIFGGKVDFDPGPGEDIHQGKTEGAGPFLSKFDNSGDFIWARTWATTDLTAGCTPEDIDIDSLGETFLTGHYVGTVDFDPGVGEDIHTTTHREVFLMSFDNDGIYRWVRTWGGATGYDYGIAVAVHDSGAVYISGDFGGTINFDPGTGEEFHTSNGYNDCFVSKFNTSGDFFWARTWGGTDSDHSDDVAVSTSQSAYVTGYFIGPVDFDPGPGEDWHYGNLDVFLCKIPPDGNW